MNRPLQQAVGWLGVGIVGLSIFAALRGLTQVGAEPNIIAVAAVVCISIVAILSGATKTPRGTPYW
ncbi:hypothetical protein [Natronocalculus amylovorans]|uniref:Uncharacterized protein n=1 Tax=Natronocalculus amylovorans TaxID=2917812 RepID=A0AAE3FZI1_9EURY|nr:hypothetical protein [Natronocalculus amylovorans]MCL9817908.1 hypothetical protein [Natronocalculus amylovorans]NUE03157.1 hypothetical protein [Halorubraceae archaeon YAN]